MNIAYCNLCHEAVVLPAGMGRAEFPAIHGMEQCVQSLRERIERLEKNASTGDTSK